uniref:GDSL-type esterase/lipase family protein n=1 Tax=Agarivorans sp. TaxID=1872412 RepID=UPI003CFE7113
MIKILCFGDSNTWGYQANSGKRFAKDQRWPGILAKLIGCNVQVLENGLPGRTTYLNAADFGLRCGIEDLLAEFSRQQPDWLIIMLGTNDLFPAFGLNAEQVAENLAKMLLELNQYCAQQQLIQPQLLIVAPLAINSSGNFAELFRGAEQHSQQLAHYYQRLANDLNCEFIDAADYLRPNLA